MSLWRPLPDPDGGPPRRPDWLMGTGATPLERRLVWATAAAATLLAGLVARRADVNWTSWQWLIVAAVTIDLVGGPVANSLASARRLYHQPLPPQATRAQRLLHDPIAFTAMHVQPFVLAVVLPGQWWPWAVTLYGTALAGVLTVRTAPAHLTQPSAFAAVVLSFVTQALVDTPPGLPWLGPIFALKLVLAHVIPDDGGSPTR